MWGKTDEEGGEVIENKVEIPDFNATIAYTLGLPLDEVSIHPPVGPLHSLIRGNHSPNLYKISPPIETLIRHLSSRRKVTSSVYSTL